jgi:23S rRNA pseudouridine2605 synthase
MLEMNTRNKNKGRSTKTSRGNSKSFDNKDKKVRKFNDFKDKVKKGDPLPSFSENVRLNKFLSNAGLCSRREADTYIGMGIVTVNGEAVTEMGYKVKPGDVVKYDGQTISAETKQYVLLNKPKGFITTMDDPQGRKTVMSLVRKACKERIYPVGRMDKETTGLMLFTNDGDLAKKLTHPKKRAKKLYQVSLNKKVTTEHINQMTSGVKLKDSTAKFDNVEFVKKGDGREVGVELMSGKTQLVRMTFEALGYSVNKIDRITFAGLTKKDLPRGMYRHLTEKEVAFLKMN